MSTQTHKGTPCRRNAAAAPRLDDATLHLLCHDLRVPLTAISAYAELLATASITDEQRAQFAHSIALQGRRLSRMVDNLETLAADGRCQCGSDVFDAHTCAEAAAGEIRPLADARGVAVEVTSAPGRYFSSGLSTALVGALVWLLDAAQRVGRRGDVVRVSLDHEAGRVRVAVHFPPVAVNDEDLAGLRDLTPGSATPDLVRGIASSLWIALRGFTACGGELRVSRVPDSVRFELSLHSVEKLPE